MLDSTDIPSPAPAAQRQDYPPRALALGQAARQFVRGERGLDRAAERLRAGLLPLLGRPPPP